MYGITKERAACDREMVDAIREVLGKRPLYGADAPRDEVIRFGGQPGYAGRRAAGRTIFEVV